MLVDGVEYIGSENHAVNVIAVPLLKLDCAGNIVIDADGSVLSIVKVEPNVGVDTMALFAKSTPFVNVNVAVPSYMVELGNVQVTVADVLALLYVIFPTAIIPPPVVMDILVEGNEFICSLKSAVNVNDTASL